MDSISIVKRFTLSVIFFAVSSQAMAGEAAIQKKLNQLIPNAPAANIKESVIPNLYEVSLGGKIIYMSSDGQYIVNGHIIDLDTRENLTEQALNKTRKTTLDRLSASSMIVYPAQGQKKRTITVFSDIDCPYCRKLHKEIPVLNQAGIEVRYMAYPRAGIGSEAYKKAVSVWCAQDSAKAMDKAMTNGHVTSKTCQNPVQKHMQQAEMFGVTGTPYILFDSGKMIPGYAPAKELIKLLVEKAS